MTSPQRPLRESIFRRQYIVLFVAALSLGLLIVPSLLRIAYANASPQTLPFSQNWSNTGLITTNDNWSGVPGIEGFLGQNLTSANDVDPQTVLGTSPTANDLDVIANQTATTNVSGGVAEFHTTSQPAALGGNNSTIGLQGSGTADAPHIILYLNTTGQMNVNVAYNLRDIECTTDNAQQQVALQYRVGNSGNFTNIPAGYVADATTGPSLCTQVTAVAATLPAAANNQSEVQVRIISTNAGGNDEWVGIDDINITATPIPTATTFTVNTTSDLNDGTCNAAHCSLREAINAANGNTGLLDTIAFNIPAPSPSPTPVPLVIQPLTKLPTITDPVTIDGYTQPGSSVNTLVDGNNAVLLIVIDGSMTLGEENGLEIRPALVGQGGGGGSTIRGLVINNFNSVPISDTRAGVAGVVSISVAGISIANVSDCNVFGCYIGTNAAGVNALPNFNGVSVADSNNHHIGGADPSQRNLISGNEQYGVDLSNVSNSFVQNNYIGTNAAGSAALGNGDGGVNLNSSSNNLIGGVEINEAIAGVERNAQARAVARENPARDVYVRQGKALLKVGSKSVGGKADLFANKVENIGGNFVFGENFRNVISGNGGAGIRISGDISDPPSTNNRIEDNFIGVDGDTDSESRVGVPNNGPGVFIDSTADDTTITSNFIAYNATDGIQIAGSTDTTNSTGNNIAGNAISNNGDLGIDLGDDGVTDNDESDLDSGPNNLQNFPVLTSATNNGSVTRVEGTLNSTPNTSFNVEFFFTLTQTAEGTTTSSCDESGHGEGLNSFGSRQLITDADGNATFQFDFSPVAVGHTITATATAPSNNTSEFSNCEEVVDDSCPDITLSPETLPDGTVSAAYNQDIDASGGSGSYTFDLTSGALPPGLMLNTTTGAISGTPTTSNGSPFSFTITATDANGCTGSRAYSIAINCPTVTLSPASLPAGTVGAAYNQDIDASGTPGPFTFMLTSGVLPPGLMLDTATGQISGTPTTSSGGPFNFTVTATDSAAGCSGSRAYSIAINCPTITLSPASLPNGNVGTPYSQSLTASGTPGPFTFTVASGSLPPGLVLSGDGLISGNPNTTGTSNFTVTATDTAAGCSGSRAYSITIEPAGKPLIRTSFVLVRNGSDVVATITLMNAGTGPAQNVQLTTARLGGVIGTPLPQAAGTIAVGASVQRTVTFPGAPSGPTTLTIAGTYTGGNYSSTIRAMSPGALSQ